MSKYRSTDRDLAASKAARSCFYLSI